MSGIIVDTSSSGGYVFLTILRAIPEAFFLQLHGAQIYLDNTLHLYISKKIIIPATILPLNR